MIGARYQHGPESEEACVEWCWADDTCLAVDFQVNNQECWMHGEGTCDAELRPNAQTTHTNLVRCREYHIGGWVGGWILSLMFGGIT